jgi:hypothetical protein
MADPAAQRQVAAARKGSRWRLALILLGLCLVLPGCQSAAGEADARVSPLATALPPATAMSSQASPLATATRSAGDGPFAFLVLHTNDNWGETEPCG